MRVSMLANRLGAQRPRGAMRASWLKMAGDEVGSQSRRSLFRDPEHPALGHGVRGTHIYYLPHVKHHASCLASSILFPDQGKLAGGEGHPTLWSLHCVPGMLGSCGSQTSWGPCLALRSAWTTFLLSARLAPSYPWGGRSYPEQVSSSPSLAQPLANWLHHAH